MENNSIISGQIYHHFKGNNYLILGTAKHTETDETLVIYKALYGDCKAYARPLTMFLEKVDHEKYPNVKQEYRFEPINLPDLKDLKSLKS